MATVTHILGRTGVPQARAIEITNGLFGVLEDCAAQGRSLPTNAELAALMQCSPQTVNRARRTLTSEQRIQVECNGGSHRKVTILIGEQAGKVTEKAAHAGMPKPKAPPPPVPIKPAPVKPAEPRPCCQWCEREFTRARGRETYCGTHCRDAARNYGPLVTKRQVEARRKHVESQPRGCKTVEAWIAAGGQVYREPPRPHYGAGA